MHIKQVCEMNRKIKTFLQLFMRLCLWTLLDILDFNYSTDYNSGLQELQGSNHSRTI